MKRSDIGSAWNTKGTQIATMITTRKFVAESFNCMQRLMRISNHMNQPTHTKSRNKQFSTRKDFFDIVTDFSQRTIAFFQSSVNIVSRTDWRRQIERRSRVWLDERIVRVVPSVEEMRAEAVVQIVRPSRDANHVAGRRKKEAGVV